MDYSGVEHKLNKLQNSMQIAALANTPEVLTGDLYGKELYGEFVESDRNGSQPSQPDPLKNLTKGVMTQ